MRHDWANVAEAVVTTAQGLPYGTEVVTRCLRCGKLRDEAIARRNRNNRKRGKGTSAELAAYLGWQNVEGMNWSHDVQGRAARIQSKRDATARSKAAIAALITGIPAGDYLRAAYIVSPRQRLASGTVWLLLEEWVAERGWSLPEATLANAAGVPLLSLPLSAFRELVGGTR